VDGSSRFSAGVLAAVVPVVLLVVSFALFWLVSGRLGASSVEAEAVVASPPRLQALPCPGGNTSLWVTELTLVLHGRGLRRPVPVDSLVVYVRVETGNGTLWIRAERSSVCSSGYSYWGDAVVVPGEEARLHVTIMMPAGLRPVEALVAVRLGGLGTVYAGPVRLTAGRPAQH